MTKKSIIEAANKRTELRGKALDLDVEFLIALQLFCKETFWYWRRKTATFNTVAATPTYDLTAAAGGTSKDFHTFCKDGVRLVRTSADVKRLSPVFGIQAQDEYIEATDQDEPSAYFIEPGTSKTMRLVAIPAAVYKIRYAYWAVPDLAADDPTLNAVPLVPGHLHHILIKALERQILRNTVGEGAARYVRCDAEYEKDVADARTERDFAQGRVREYRDEDDAIRSTE
jgi:hypothetical protein